MKIYSSVLELIGNTPLLQLNNLKAALELDSDIILKLEYFNPLGSVKDRVGSFIISSALKRGEISKETLVIEATSGNTGIGLAFTCATLNMKCVIVMPDNMSKERISILKALGSEVVLTPAALGMKGAVEKAEEIKNLNSNSFITNQFNNPDNVLAHKTSTAKEILADTDGKIDYFVAGIGTGGTISGVGELLKESVPSVKIVGAEPLSSPLFTQNRSGVHKIQGIGANFIPKIFNKGVCDEIVAVSNEAAYETVRLVAKTEGVLLGISSGAAISAAIDIAKKEKNKRIVALCPDGGEKYLSTDLFEV